MITLEQFNEAALDRPSGEGGELFVITNRPGWISTRYFACYVGGVTASLGDEYIRRESKESLAPGPGTRLIEMRLDESLRIPNERGMVLADDAIDCGGCECGKCCGKKGARVPGVVRVGQEVYRSDDGAAAVINPCYGKILLGLTVKVANPGNVHSQLYGFDASGKCVAVVMQMNVTIRETEVQIAKRLASLDKHSP